MDDPYAVEAGRDEYATDEPAPAVKFWLGALMVAAALLYWLFGSGVL